MGSVCTESNSKSAEVVRKLAAATSSLCSTLFQVVGRKDRPPGSSRRARDAAKTQSSSSVHGFPCCQLDAKMRRATQQVRSAMRPDLPDEVALVVPGRLPALHEDGVAGDRLNGLAQRLLHLAVRGACGNASHPTACTETIDSVAAVADHLDGVQRAGRAARACRQSSTGAAMTKMNSRISVTITS